VINLSQTGNASLLRNEEWRKKRLAIFTMETAITGGYKVNKRKRFNIGSTPVSHLIRYAPCYIKKKQEKQAGEKEE